MSLSDDLRRLPRERVPTIAVNSKTQAHEYSRMLECCDADLAARLLVLLECLSSWLSKLFSPKSSRIFRRSRRILLAQRALLTNL